MRIVERVELPPLPHQVIDGRHNLDAGRLGLENDMVPIVLHGQVVDTTHQLVNIDPHVDMGTE